MEKRYQVFVSSTFQDLEDERQEVMQALLELDCMPAGMELFPAANEDQWSLIKKVIDGCDYYILIIGGRYGSIGPEGLSYTEMEYRYASSQGKPTIAFIHQDPGLLPANRTELTPEGRAKLDSFRALAQQKLVRFWTSPVDLGSVVSRSVSKLMRTVPATGWIRADQIKRDSDEAEPGEGPNWENVGSLFWLVHDLLWTVDELLNGPPEAASVGLRQARHHLSEIGMAKSHYGRSLDRWLEEIEGVSRENWTPEQRSRWAAKVDRLVTQLGALAETHQKGFRASHDE